MRNSFRLLISLSFAVLPLYSLAIKPVTAAEILNSQDAAAHLARAHSAAEKCGHLSLAQLDELSSYVNAAEVVVAGQIGSEAVLRLMKRGQESGKAMSCGYQTEELATAALEAARVAMQQAGQEDFQQAAHLDVNTGPAYDEQQLSIRPSVVEVDQAARVIEPLSVETEQPKPAKKVEKKPEPVKTTAVKQDLSQYARATAAYYVERRCGHLNHSQAMNFWKAIVSKHNAALTSHSRSDVARAKAQAIAMANQTGGCGSRTRQLVTAGLSLVR